MSARQILMSMALLILTACPATKAEEVMGSIGASGGTLSHPAGAKLTVPAGALGADVQLGIKNGTAPDTAALGATAVGGAFVLSPEGQQFLTPVQLELPYDPTRLPAGESESTLRIRISPQSAPAYTELETTVDTTAHLLKATTTHFSVVVPSTRGAGCTDVTTGGNFIPQVKYAQAAPSSSGGQLVSGTYRRTADALYTGVGGTTAANGKVRKETLRITVTSPTTGKVETAIERTAGVVDRAVLNFTTSGSTITLSETCPGKTNTLSLSYTFNADTFVVSQPEEGNTHVSTFTLYTGTDTTPDAGSSTPDAGSSAPSLETIGTGLTDLVALEVTSSSTYVLGGGQIKSCALTGCGSSATLIASAFASSIAVSQSTLFASTNFRYISSCDLSGTCSLTSFTDVGANTYPAHLRVANDRVYWVSEAGTTRRIQSCPLSGCSSGYPKTVYEGALLTGVPVSGLALNATHAYVSSYTGGIFRIGLTDPDTSDIASAKQLSPSGYGTGGLDLDGTTLRWVNVMDGTVLTCAAPDCASVSPVVSSLVSPAGVRSDATHVYGINRGTPTGTNSWAAGSASIWRYRK